MFETTLETALKKIFDVPIVTYSKPDPKNIEQNVLFVDVVKAVIGAKEKKATARVTAEVTMYAPANKLKFGFFGKRLYMADATDTAPFYFYNLEESDKLYGDLVERRCKFIYFFSSEYDPEHGSLTSVEF